MHGALAASLRERLGKGAAEGAGRWTYAWNSQSQSWSHLQWIRADVRNSCSTSCLNLSNYPRPDMSWGPILGLVGDQSQEEILPALKKLPAQSRLQAYPMTSLILSHKDKTRDPQGSEHCGAGGGGRVHVGGRVGREGTESTEQRQTGGRMWDGLCVHAGWSLLASG